MQFLLAFQIIANEPDAPSLSLPLQMYHCHLQAESGRAAPADATQKRSLLQKFLFGFFFFFLSEKLAVRTKYFFFSVCFFSFKYSRNRLCFFPQRPSAAQSEGVKRRGRPKKEVRVSVRKRV